MFTWTMFEMSELWTSLWSFIPLISCWHLRLEIDLFRRYLDPFYRRKLHLKEQLYEAGRRDRLGPRRPPGSLAAFLLLPSFPLSRPEDWNEKTLKPVWTRLLNIILNIYHLQHWESAQIASEICQMVGPKFGKY